MDFDSTNYNTDELLNILEINQSGDFSLDNVFNKTKINAHANSSIDWPYLKTKPETKNPIDQPVTIKLKKNKIKKNPKSNKCNPKK